MTEKVEKKCVVLLSGGMDSSVVLAYAVSKGFEVHAISFDYGQRHVVELEFAKKQAKNSDVKSHKIFKLDIGSFGSSSLTASQDVPKTDSVEELTEEIPSTYVPARNTVFLSIGLSFAESIGAKDIFLGVSSVDYSGYPDCRPEFIESFQNTANLGTKEADSGKNYKIHAPLLKLNKKETVELGLSLGVDFKSTRTCYDPDVNGNPCGKCDSCLLRLKGFEEAGLEDPVKAC